MKNYILLIIEYTELYINMQFQHGNYQRNRKCNNPVVLRNRYAIKIVFTITLYLSLHQYK